MGTIKWSFEDDTGRKHDKFIENSLYVPDGSERLISPQHWARSATLRGGTPDGTFSFQYHNRNVLRFGSQGQYKRTVWNDFRSNVPYLMPGLGQWHIERTWLAPSQLSCSTTAPLNMPSATPPIVTTKLSQLLRGIKTTSYLRYLDASHPLRPNIGMRTSRTSTPRYHKLSTRRNKTSILQLRPRSANSFAGAIVLDICHSRNFSFWP